MVIQFYWMHFRFWSHAVGCRAEYCAEEYGEYDSRQTLRRSPGGRDLPQRRDLFLQD